MKLGYHDGQDGGTRITAAILKLPDSDACFGRGYFSAKKVVNCSIR
jgi:hypothetical protein